jgi:two-component system, OmpR family, response regulator TctD
MMRILLVEDVADLADAVRAHLTSLGYAVEWCANGNEVDEILKELSFDLIVLDIMLPGRDGFRILADLRHGRSRIPVLVTTALSAIDDKVNLLDLGADDYIVKPYDMREFTARVRALLRRVEGERTSRLRFGKLTFDSARRQASLDGSELDLTRRELQLVELLVGRFGATIHRERLIDRIFTGEDGVGPNALEVLVSRLRKKLEGADLELATVRGIGYVLREAQP